MKALYIIQKVDEKLPNIMPEEEKITILNNLQRYLFDDILKGKVLIIEKYDIVAGQADYSITGYTINDIKDLFVGNRRYDKRGPNNYQDKLYSYCEIDGNICLYPTPSSDLADGLVIYRYDTPTEITQANVGDVELILGDYYGQYDLFKYYLMAQIAYDQKQINDYNNHALRYNTELIKLKSWVMERYPDTSTNNLVKNYW
ncbi:hypothetical protein BR63_11195 [Thermanaerosceptrum fracticalcis]|uniref:Uncharacterized protein n=1 Tax=Thermanaerosceptrum fracticalcis TaxID=1712410 RepID=A0A7G6E422_THEFR|nr:hypothetical protein [Thermanaerosceptrum fracticalcis]QNB46826.1 hypothetical protein BR63_11195 [Thermanaerosceptrum fracticalcis]